VVVVRTYDGQACVNSGDFVPGFETQIINNTCILPPEGSDGKRPDMVAHVDQACLAPAAGNLIARDNRYHTVNGNASAACGDGSVRRIADMPPPFEAGSSAHALPDGDTIIAWGREKLRM